MLDRARRTGPGSPYPYLLAARLLESGKLLESAEKAQARGAELNPFRPASWIELARIRQARGDAAGARVAMEEGRRWVPWPRLIARDSTIANPDWATAQRNTAGCSTAETNTSPCALWEMASAIASVAPEVNTTLFFQPSAAATRCRASSRTARAARSRCFCASTPITSRAPISGRAPALRR